MRFSVSGKTEDGPEEVKVEAVSSHWLSGSVERFSLLLLVAKYLFSFSPIRRERTDAS